MKLQRRTRCAAAPQTQSVRATVPESPKIPGLRLARVMHLLNGAYPEFTLEGHVVVNMDPSVESPYEADLVLDGVTGAFTCGSSGDAGSAPTNRTGSGESVDSLCFGGGFTIVGTPASVEISVNAQDGSWTGSVKESPSYERMTVCGTLCPPRAVVTVRQQ